MGILTLFHILAIRTHYRIRVRSETSIRRCSCGTDALRHGRSSEIWSGADNLCLSLLFPIPLSPLSSLHTLISGYCICHTRRRNTKCVAIRNSHVSHSIFCEHSPRVTIVRRLTGVVWLVLTTCLVLAGSYSDRVRVGPGWLY